MKTLTTILAAAFIAGSAGLAMAQGSGAPALPAATQTQQGTMKDADKNPTGAGANPAAGNTGAQSQGAARDRHDRRRDADSAGVRHPEEGQLDAGSGADRRQEVISLSRSMATARSMTGPLALRGAYTSASCSPTLASGMRGLRCRPPSSKGSSGTGVVPPVSSVRSASPPLAIRCGSSNSCSGLTIGA